MRHCGELRDTRRRPPATVCFFCKGASPVPAWPGAMQHDAGLLQRCWSKPSRPVCLTGALHPFLMSPVGTPPEEGCLKVCPRGRGEMGLGDALKLWLAPRVRKRLIRCAPGRPAQYTAPKWASTSPLFPPFNCPLECSGSISSPSVATHTWCFCMSAFETM